MAHEQFFFSKKISTDLIIIEAQEHQHLSRVMRKQSGEQIWISDGRGNAYLTEILEIGKENTQCKIVKTFPMFGEPANKVSLAVGIIKASHWEIMLEKAVELGVHDIYPLITRYTVVPNIKRERNEKILLSALKQSGRTYLPVLHDPIAYKDFFRTEHKETLIICDNQGDYSSLGTPDSPKDYLVLIGPEGGFTKEEVDLALDHGANPVLLANRRLRTETACLSALGKLVVDS